MSGAYRPDPSLAYRVIEEHVFIITPDSRQHELDGPVELFIWRLCEKQPQTYEELVNAVISHFNVDIETAKNDLDVFLRDMSEAGVFTTNP